MEQHFSNLNPPSANEAPTENQSKEFLNLLKSLERAHKDDSDSYEIESEVLDTLSNMTALYRVRGLFTSEESRAKYARTPGDGNEGRSSSNTKKRKRGGASGSGNITSILNLDGNNSSEEAYVLSNLCRVLIPCNEKGVIYPPSVVACAANAMNSICQYSLHLLGEKIMVEQDMIASIASQLINGLSKTMKHMVAMIEVDDVLIACCNCAKNIIVLSNLKLSRNGSIMASIHSVANEIIEGDEKGSVEISGAVEAAASVAASIPLVGNSNGVAPMKLWSEMVLQQSEDLTSTLQAFFPLVKSFKWGKRLKGEGDLEWISNVRSSIASQASRLVVFFARVKGYVTVLKKLLELDGYEVSNIGDGAVLPISVLLNVSDQLLHFSSIAETRFLTTKSRLRDVSIEGGLLSPNAAVTIGNSMKHLGFTLFESVVSSLSTTALQYGKQLSLTSLNSLQSCSTMTLRRVVESSSGADKNSRKKWLHSSVQLRTRSIEIFSMVAQRLGPNLAVTQNDQLSKGLALIAGCLLEQTSSSDEGESSVIEHWGTETERAKLMVACCDAFTTALNVFGGYLTMQNRELIESMASTCLGNIEARNSPKRYYNFALVKVAVIQLGISCVSNPWPDGASSGLVQVLRQTAFALKFDRDRDVSSRAYLALSICNMAVMPRAPPLVIVTRTNDAESGMMNPSRNLFFSRETLEGGISAVREDILRAKIIDKDMQEKRASVKKERAAIKAKSLMEKETRKSSKTFKDEEMIDVENNDDLKTSDVDEELDKGETDGTNDQSESDGTKGDGIESNPNKIASVQVHVEDGSVENIEIDKDDESSDSDEDGSDDDDFPPIIDCGPDDEDM